MARSRSDPGQGSGPPRYPGTFLLAFREAVEGLQWKIGRWLGDAVECLDASGEKQTVGLENLFRRARRAPRAEWPTVIRDFLSRVGPTDRNEVAEANDLAKQGLAAVADRLLVRIGQPFGGLAEALPVWSKPLGTTGLNMNLVLDHTNTMSYVTAEMVANSNQPGEAWLERGLANLRARTPQDFLENITEDSSLLVGTVGDAYDAARALLVEEMLGDKANLGVFIAVPSRDQLLVLPVSKEALAQVHIVKLLAVDDHKKAPYAISDEVYWVRGGEWRLFPIAIKNQEVTLTPPPEFVEELGGLAPPGPE